MQKIICSCFLILCWIAGFAQTNQASASTKTPEQRAERITNWMNKKLALTADQKSKIYDVNLKYAKLNQETKTNDAGDKKTMHQELKASEKEREEEFKAILTPDQFQSFQTAKQDLMEKRKERKRKS